MINKTSFRPALERFPSLGVFGFVTLRRREDADDYLRRHAYERGQLVAEIDAVMQAAEWLAENVPPADKPTVSSYAVKHKIERSIGRYVPNGHAIVAAAMLGYPIGKPDGPNARLGVDRAAFR